MIRILDRTWWGNWRRKLQRRSSLRLLERHRQVLQEGIYIRAKVLDFHESGRMINNLQLIRVRISIRFPDGAQVQVVSSTLATYLPAHLRNCSVRMKILAGDLQHIVLMN